MRKLSFLALIICTLLLSACDSGNVIVPTVTPTAAPTATEIPLTPTGILSPTFMLNENKEIYYYVVNGSTRQKEAVTAVIPSETEVTPQVIMDLVTDSFEEHGFNLGIDNITTDNKSLIVSFKDDSEPVIGLDAGTENEMLDAIAQSLLDNLTQYNKIIFRVMGGRYKSANNSFDIDYVYMDYNR